MHGDDYFVAEFDQVFNNTDIQEAGDDPIGNYDGYVGTEVALKRGQEYPELFRVAKYGRLIGWKPGDNQFAMDASMYEVKYRDCATEPISANKLVENMFPQVDQKGLKYSPFHSIIGHKVDGTQVKSDDAFWTIKKA